MNRIRFILRYIKYLLQSKTRHGTHSPFVYGLIEEVIYNDNSFYAFQNIERARKSLLASDKVIEITDYGAGSTFTGSKKRKISDIALHSAKPAKFGKLLFRLVNKFQPATMLELGTSLGISTLYQAGANHKARFITLEGCPETSKIARETLEKSGIQNVEVRTGPFEQTLLPALKELGSVDYVFFDGNHRKEPTLTYFNECISFANNKSLFIFDDIHWSDEMEEAWQIIKNHPEVSVTIDLFFIGLVFFRKEQAKEHFIVKF